MRPKVTTRPAVALQLVEPVVVAVAVAVAPDVVEHVVYVLS